MARRTTKKANSSLPMLGYYKLHKDVQDFDFATDGSACFDVRAYLPHNSLVTAYNDSNHQRVIMSKPYGLSERYGIMVDAGDRVLIPTGYILDIPDGYSIRVHPRSGFSLKSGIALANMEGVIDSDYVNELYVAVWNISRTRVFIGHGDRIAQCELQEVVQFNTVKLDKAPSRKTQRDGGFGSTGKL